MSWTERRDDSPCCDGPYGHVIQNERLGRTKIVRTAEPLFWTAFNLTDLFPPASGNQDNACGLPQGQDGFSVDRIGHLAVEEVFRRSELFAARGRNRIGDGAFVALAGAVRAIKPPLSDVADPLRIYDDAIVSNLEHAVIRANETIPIEERLFVAEDLQALFEGEHLKPA